MLCIRKIETAIPLTKTTAAKNEVVLNYHMVRGQYF